MKPSRERIAEIAAKQDAKAAARKTAQRKRKSHEEEQAAQMIQRNYRGYRERRQLAGMSLDPSARWVEVCTYSILSEFLIYYLCVLPELTRSSVQAMKEGSLSSFRRDNMSRILNLLKHDGEMPQNLSHDPSVLEV